MTQSLIEELYWHKYRTPNNDYVLGYNDGIDDSIRIIQDHFSHPEVVDALADAMRRGETGARRPWEDILPGSREDWRITARNAIAKIMGDASTSTKGDVTPPASLTMASPMPEKHDPRAPMMDSGMAANFIENL